jgi:hypothetical protein
MKKLKTAPIQLDTERLIGFNFVALEAIEKELGKDPLSEDFWEDPAISRAKRMQVVIWAGLLHADPSITLQSVGEMMQVADFEHYTNAVLAAWIEPKPADPQPPTAVPA